ncbi:hypothetical protein HK102_002445 [Quaeritorhiza haematococci]|nr:hypothetical protein HK102_002445 [Quaeritorhiza haematococci]
MTFSVEFIPDLSGKVAIVTGGNRGIGFQTVTALVSKGAHVIIASRSQTAGESAVQQIQDHFPKAFNVKCEWMPIDLADLSSVEKFAEAFLRRGLELHLLINNAGTVEGNPTTTRNNIDFIIGVNHVGHFHLTNLLLPVLKKTATASPDSDVRIINVTSDAAWGVNWGVSNVLKSEEMWEKWANGTSVQSALMRYSWSKLMNITFTLSLAHRLQDSRITAYACHPGFTQSDMPSKVPGVVGKFVLGPLGNLFATKIDVGAHSTLFVATAEHLKFDERKRKAELGLGGANGQSVDEEGLVYGGELFGQSWGGYMVSPVCTPDQTKKLSVPAGASNKEFQDKLWGWTEEVIKSRR